MEPCGCAGLDRMKGGMSRRHTLFKQLRDQGCPVVGIDVGGLAKGYGRQTEMKFHIMVEGMRTMGYSAIELGRTDLRLPAGELASDVASSADQPSPFLSANVALFGFAAELTARSRVVDAGGTRFGITGILGKQFQGQLQNDEIEMSDPATALAAVVPDLKARADVLILLAHAGKEESIELAKKFPQFDLVVTVGGGSEPPADFEKIPGSKALLVEVGDKGMDAVVLGMYDDPKQRFRYQRVPLDSRFPASPEMKMLMSIYQEQLKNAGWDQLGIRPVPHPQQELLGGFVGSRECESCHEVSNDVWKKSGHAKAIDTLVNADPPRQFDPECVACHVVGWNSEQYFPYQTGFVSQEKTPKLVDVGCESCHGPGEAHVRAENGSDLALQEKLQKAMIVTKADAEKQLCRTCHDLDNSPEFNFETYWPKVEHYETE